MRESYAPAILSQKTKRLRKSTGNLDLISALQSPHSPSTLLKLSIIRPLKMLFMSPIIFLLSLYTAIVVCHIRSICVAMSSPSKPVYSRIHPEGQLLNTSTNCISVRLPLPPLHNLPLHILQPIRLLRRCLRARLSRYRGRLDDRPRYSWHHIR